MPKYLFMDTTKSAEKAFITARFNMEAKNIGEFYGINDEETLICLERLDEFFMREKFSTHEFLAFIKKYDLRPELTAFYISTFQAKLIYFEAIKEAKIKGFLKGLLD